MKLYILIFCLLPACKALSFESLLLDEWRAFKSRFNKTYATPLEEGFRREIFLENRHKIALHNIEFGRGRRTFTLASNGYADMLNHEFTFTINGFNRTGRLTPEISEEGANFEETAQGDIPQTRFIQGEQLPGNIPLPKIMKIRPSYFIKPLHTKLPESMDWRELGGVTPVKSQGMCASCYAFSAAGALEGHYFRKTGKLMELSPQNLLDCSQRYGNAGCQGGFMDAAYEYVRDNFGINSEPTYSYEMRQGQCRFNPEDRAADTTGYVQIETGDEEAIKEAVATLGPVSAAIDAGQDSFQFYSNGFYYDPDCQNDASKLNHGVLIIGYGVEPDGKEYWLVKNSYGPQWGEGGYIKMARNVENHCGIATSAAYPLV